MNAKLAAIRGILLMAIFMFSLFQCGSPGKEHYEKVKILILHSYHIEYPWTRSINDGIMEVLADKGFNIKTLFMDTKRNTDEAFKIKAGKKALDIVNQFKPTIVIATDDNAQDYVGKFLVNKKNISIVFCGVNADVEKYNYPGNNVTGIRERPFIRSSLNLLKKVAPGVHSYTVLTDKSPTSKGFINYLQSLKLPIHIDKIIEADDFQQWQKEAAAIESDAIITYMYHTIKEEGKAVEPKQVMKWTAEHIKKPSAGFLDFAIEDGVLLGHVESGFEHGELAAKLALEIVNGKKTTELPIITAQKGIIIVNETTASRLNIDISPIKNIADKVVK